MRLTVFSETVLRDAAPKRFGRWRGVPPLELHESSSCHAADCEFLTNMNVRCLLSFLLSKGLLLAFVMVGLPLYAQTNQVQTNQLASGWNLIALQVIPADPTPAYVSQHCRQVWVPQEHPGLHRRIQGLSRRLAPEESGRGPQELAERPRHFHQGEPEMGAPGADRRPDLEG